MLERSLALLPVTFAFAFGLTFLCVALGFAIERSPFGRRRQIFALPLADRQLRWELHATVRFCIMAGLAFAFILGSGALGAMEETAAGRPCTAEAVCKVLGVSKRTLQRRLRETGDSFRGLRAEHRMRLARSYLERPDLSLSEIAFLLGFANPQAFHRAFRRAVDQSPTTYRSLAQSTRGWGAVPQPMHQSN